MLIETISATGEKMNPTENRSESDRFDRFDRSDRSESDRSDRSDSPIDFAFKNPDRTAALLRGLDHVYDI